MMKPFSYLLVILFVSLVPLSTFGQQIKIASVDMSKLFSDYYKTKKAEEELKEKAASYEKELKVRVAEVQKIEEDGKKLQDEVENPALTEDKRGEKRKVLDTKKTEYRLIVQQLNELKQSREHELKDQQNRMRSTIVDEISKIIQDKAKRDGYMLVIDKTGLTLSGVSSFVYVQDSLDITNDILKVLNANAPAKAATPPATTGKDKDTKK